MHFTTKNTVLACGAIAALLAIGPTAVFAHHGSAAYDMSKSLTLDGTVASLDWNNPHCLLHFDAKDDKGKPLHWVAETAAPQALVLIGWSKSSLAPGDVITVYMYQAKTGNPAGRLNKIVLADGSELHDTQVGSDAGSKTRYNNPDGETPGVKPQ